MISLPTVHYWLHAISTRLIISKFTKYSKKWIFILFFRVENFLYTAVLWWCFSLCRESDKKRKIFLNWLRRYCYDVIDFSLLAFAHAHCRFHAFPPFQWSETKKLQFFPCSSLRNWVKAMNEENEEKLFKVTERWERKKEKKVDYMKVMSKA